MIKKQHIYRTFNLFSLILLVTITFSPLTTFALRSWEGADIGASGHWGMVSSSLRNKINDLDDDKVSNLPVPILFGVTPDNLTHNFGDPRSGGRSHEGLDIMAPKGAPVVTPTEAVVIRSGVGDSAGKYVYTANPGGETFVYMHLNEVADISEGDVLKKGELIGYVGNTGNASGGATHLHFEIRDNDNATDPFPRLTLIFPLKDKIEYLGKILKDVDIEKVFAESMVSIYRKELILAQSSNIDLPDSIVEALLNKTVLSIIRTLRLGFEGEDVKLLQIKLGISADGSFGPLTKAAVIAFQKSNGLIADGMFGPKSYSILSPGITTFPSGCNSSTLYSPTTGIKCVATL